MNRGLRNEIALLLGVASLGLLARRRKLGAFLGLVALGLRFLPSAESFSFERRSVVITGGSRGLGLALAKQLLQEGAYVTLLARDAAELGNAEKILDHHASVLVLACDVTNPDALAYAFDRVEAHFGRIDMLINNAGTISVGLFETMEREDFDAQLELHLHAVINAVRSVIPALQRSGGGRIVNISSIGGALPVPHMTPYCASKFALAGLSETLGAELAQAGIRVTTVYPGLMRTGSPIQAVFKGNHEKEYGWFATGDVMPGVSVSAERAARSILAGVREGRTRVAYPAVTHLGIIGHALFPELYAWLASQANRLMPKGKTRIRKTGAASKGWLEGQLWYKPFGLIEKKAEQALNQHDKYDADFNMGLRKGISSG
jgi:NAD(P)-dependent dehydrogenase (short-subunit alcohol dehydrogenase family)